MKLKMIAKKNELVSCRFYDKINVYLVLNSQHLILKLVKCNRYSHNMPSINYPINQCQKYTSVQFNKNSCHKSKIEFIFIGLQFI